MFCGIIEEIGKVQSWKKDKNLATLCVLAPAISRDIQPGQSVSVNGICLTVVRIKKTVLAFEVMPETLRTANLGSVRQNDQVNLERALKAEGRVDGHFVSGHIDATGTVLKLDKQAADFVLEIEAGQDILRYIAKKGSVAIDGVSLTVSSINNNSFQVSLIPYTLKHTTLGSKKTGDRLNIECDILAKYIERLLSVKASPPSQITPTFLTEHGFF